MELHLYMSRSLRYGKHKNKKVNKPFIWEIKVTVNVNMKLVKVQNRCVSVKGETKWRVGWGS